MLRFAHELLTKYKFDGYALDYCRFPDAESDFSPASREAFETYLGHGIDRFPEDIFTYDANGARVAGPYYKQWWEFRSGVIRDFIARIRATVDELQPGVKLEYWAASWLHAIYTQGQNWASPRSRFHEAYLDDWATPTYNRTGFADLLDVFITGTYLEKVWGMDDPESIEYGLARSLKDVDGDCAVYGSLYAQNHVDQFEDAVYLCLSRTDGVMVFDIIQVIETIYGMTSNVVSTGLKKNRKLKNDKMKKSILILCVLLMAAIPSACTESHKPLRNSTSRNPGRTPIRNRNPQRERKKCSGSMPRPTSSDSRHRPVSSPCSTKHRKRDSTRSSWM